MSQPITLYSPDGKVAKQIAAIDAPGWLRSGWSLDPVAFHSREVLGESGETIDPTTVATKSKSKTTN